MVRMALPFTENGWTDGSILVRPKWQDNGIVPLLIPSEYFLCIQQQVKIWTLSDQSIRYQTS